MRRTVRVFAAVGPAERLGAAISAMPSAVVGVLVDVAARTDLPLAAGTWGDDDAGCLVANAVACVARAGQGHDGDERTLDLRMLDAFPQMSSRDLNSLIVAWDEASAQAAATDDAAMRALLLQGLAWAGVTVPDTTGAPQPADTRDSIADATTPAPHGDDAGVVPMDLVGTY